MADLIVLGGCAVLENATQNAGASVRVPFVPVRIDALLLEETDAESYAVLEATSDNVRI